MVDETPGWLVLQADLTPDWDAFYAHWWPIRVEAEGRGRQAGSEAFAAQQAAGWALVDAADAQQAVAKAVRKAERHAASVERRRRHNAAWMREYRARKEG